MKLGHKITVVTVATVVSLGLLTILLISYVLSDALRQSVQDKEIALTRVVANDLANPVLNGNYLTVQQEMESLLSDSHLGYVFLILPDGRVMHTFKGNITSELVELNRLQRGKSYALSSLSSDQGRMEDVGVYLLDGLDSELHIGFKEDYIQATLGSVFKTIFLLTGIGVLLGSLAAGALGKYLSSPIAKLTKVTREIADGHLDQRVKIVGRDEVGELAQSFNRMVEALQHNMADLQEAQAEQLIKNRELTALNVVAETVTLEQDIEVMLRDALTKVIAILGLVGGWVSLRAGNTDDEQKLIVVDVKQDEIPCTACVFCDCDSNCLQRGNCLSINNMEKEGKSYIVTGVPIFSGERVFGAMHILSENDLIPSDVTTLRSIGGQLGTLVENVSLWNELKLREEKASQLLEKVMVAQEDERERIARELHDETSQSLAALAMRLKTGQGWLKRDLYRAEELMEESKNETVRIMRELHNIIYHLRPTLLDDLGLIPALRWLAESRDWGRTVQVDVHGEWRGDRIGGQVETALFRIGQEAITNAAKYSDATKLVIEFNLFEREAILQIKDNGRGFAWDDSAQNSNGKKPLGILGMMERASLLGGRVTINALPGTGTSVIATIPLQISANQ